MYAKSPLSCLYLKTCHRRPKEIFSRRRTNNSRVIVGARAALAVEVEPLFQRLPPLGGGLGARVVHPVAVWKECVNQILVFSM